MLIRNLSDFKNQLLACLKKEQWHSISYSTIISHYGSIANISAVMMFYQAQVLSMQTAIVLCTLCFCSKKVNKLIFLFVLGLSLLTGTFVVTKIVIVEKFYGDNS